MKNFNPMLLIARLGCSVGVILFAVIIAGVLWRLKPVPETQVPQEAVMAVELLTAEASDLTVEIETQGIVNPLRKVLISPQVGGRVVEMPRELKVGDLVQKDQLLLKIDPIDYQTALAEASATLSRIEANLEMIRINEASDRKLLTFSERSRDLAKKDFERVKKLSDEGQAVSVSVVESTERTYTQAQSQVLQLQQSLDQIPSRIKEMESELAAAKARREQSELQLARTELRAPFQARVMSSNVEVDEVLQPGQVVFELADDSSLEIAVPVTASDLRDWIPFEAGSASDQGWFPPLQKVPVSIRWSASKRDSEWKGHLDRLMRFDATTRTAMLAVRISGDQLKTHATGLPLTEGMFCQVLIPGNTLKNVIKIPRSAVTFDEMCYLNVDGRLKTVAVVIARAQGDFVYVSEGLKPGDQVITTRLVAPLEGVKLLEAGV